jgi:hypothetical protein
MLRKCQYFIMGMGVTMLLLFILGWLFWTTFLSAIVWWGFASLFLIN